MQDVSQVLSTVADVMNFMSPYAGGSVPSEGSTQYNSWLRWIQVKQEEYARRGFWRRLLTKDTSSLLADATYDLLPERFHKPNGLYVYEVGGVDWAEEDNDDDQVIFTEMITDSTDENYTRWKVNFGTAVESAATATFWYFANVPKPTLSTDKLVLPGDMVGFGALSEYFRSIGSDGSQDDARIEAENRYKSYLALEVIPARYELLRFSTAPRKTNFLERAKGYYSSRTNRSQYA